MSYDSMNRYWLPNLNINKKVITQELQYYLGPDSSVRPFTRDGEDGFLITTPGECLTDEQIDDICRKSLDVWEKQAAARIKKEADNNRSESDKPLKRPLHQPIVVSRGNTSQRSGNDDDRRSGDSGKRSGERNDRRRSDEDRGWDRDSRSGRGDSYRGSGRR